jgi:hypothetical protein
MGSLYVFSGFVTNPGDAILTNVVVFSSQAGQNLPLLGPIDLAPGQSEQYTGSLTVASNIFAVTVTVTSQETCKGTWITNTVSCPVATTVLIIGTPNVNAGGFFSLSFPTEKGKSYTVQYKNTLSDPTWTDLVPPGSVPGTGGVMTITDSSLAALHPSRFYRIMSTP